MGSNPALIKYIRSHVTFVSKYLHAIFGLPKKGKATDPSSPDFLGQMGFKPATYHLLGRHCTNYATEVWLGNVKEI